MKVPGIGDKVRLIDENREGTVSRISQGEYWVEIDGMDLPFELSQIVKVEHDELISLKIRESKLTPKDKSLQSTGKSKLKQLADPTQAVYEIDLHIDALLDRHAHMSNGEILQYQMNHCRSFIREAIDKRYKKVVLIHGVGEGVLKTEIHRYLDQFQHIEYHDAPYRIYGYGATEVILRG